MIECYECNKQAAELSPRSRCVNCEHKRATFNEAEAERHRTVATALGDRCRRAWDALHRDDDMSASDAMMILTGDDT